MGLLKTHCLSRYVLKIWLLPFLGILSLITAIFLLQNLLVWLPALLRNDAPLTLTITLFLGLLPNVMLNVLPIAYFFALQRTVSTLQASSELDALYAGGRSVLQIFKPIFMVGVLLSMAMLWLTMQLAPLGKVTTYNTVAQLSALKSEPSFAPKRFVQGIDDITFYVEGENADGSYAHVMFADQRQQGKPVVLYTAQRATFSNSATGMVLLLEDGDQISGEKETLRATHFAQYTIQIPLDLEGRFRTLSPASDPSFMDGKTLYKALQEADVSVKYVAQWHDRLVTPLSILILFCLAIPITLQAKRSTRGGTFFIAVAVMALMNQGQLIVYKQVALQHLPWWSLWCLMLTFAALSMWLLWHVHRYGNLQHLWHGAKRRVG